MFDGDALAGLLILAVAALVLDAIPARKGKWPGGPLTAGTAERIIGGGKPAPTPRTGLQMALLLVVVFVILFVFYGG